LSNNINKNELFSFTAYPKVSGLLEYTIKIFNDNNVLLTKETIPLQVALESDVKILVLQSSPSFEIKQLQNWSAENGAKIMIKTKVSQNKYHTRMTNLDEYTKKNKTSKNGITPKMLNEFDMLIIDGRGFTDLSTVEYQWLNAAIRQGLGMLILADFDLFEKQESLNKQFNIQLKASEHSEPSLAYWPNRQGDFITQTDSTIPKAALSIIIQTNQLMNVQRLVESENNQLLVHQNSLVFGNVAISLLKSTHQWVTTGQKNIHSQYWSYLIKSISRNKVVVSQLSQLNSQLNFENHLTKLCIHSSETIKQLKLTHKDSSQQHILLLNQLNSSDLPKLSDSPTSLNVVYCGFFWPKQVGWYRVESNNKANDWVYIESKNQWSAMQQHLKIKATLEKQSRNDLLPIFQSKMSYQEINQWIFWWAFFICASLIWLERKL